MMTVPEPETGIASPEDLEKQFPFTLERFASQGLDAMVGKIREPLLELGLLLVQASMLMSPELPEAETKTLFKNALLQLLDKHPDLPLYAEGMTIAVLGLLPYTNRISAAEYVESVYCVARYSDFLEPTRWRSLLSNSNPGAFIQ